MKGVKSHQHRANRNRTSESDIPDKFRVMAIIKKYFNIRTLTDEVIPIPKGYATYRQPDLLAKHPRRIVFELDGLVHGNGDEVSFRERDERKLNDYESIYQEYYVINSAVTDGYEESKVVTTLLEQGLRPI
jgi:hypothetical protein